jgi:hypothetical protein
MPSRRITCAIRTTATITWATTGASGPAITTAAHTGATAAIAASMT